MNSKQRVLVLAALALAVVFLLARPYIFQDNTVPTAKPVKQMLEEAFVTDKPIAIVFTYGAECCPSTEQFFMAYDVQMRNTLTKFEHVETVWINVGSESNADQDEILALARDYGVTQVPSLLILDKNHQKVGLIEGEFTTQEAESLLLEVVGT